MNRLTMATKGCVQLTSNYIYFSYSCFSVVKTAADLMAEGVNYCGLVNMSHKGFCLATLEKLMKHWPGGSYLVLNSTLRVPGRRPRMDIG